MTSKPEVEIWFEAETRCNLACKFCFNYWKSGNSVAPQRVNPKRTLDALARIFQQFSCTKMTISGGEPLLREDLLEIVRFAVNHGSTVVLTTNGTLLTTEKVNSLMEAGITTFEVSLHSMDEAMHDYLSGKPSWHSTIDSILLLRSARARVVAVFVATARNLRDFIGVVKLLSLIGIRDFIFNRFVPTGLGFLNQHEIGVPKAEELIQCLIEANTVAESSGATIHLGNAIEMAATDREMLSRVEIASCPVAVGQRRWTLDVAGNLRRCNQSGLSVGNVFSGGLEQIAAEINASSRGWDGSSIRPCQILGSEPLLKILSARA